MSSRIASLIFIFLEKYRDMKEITVGKNDSGQRLDRFIEKAVPLLPVSLLQKYIRIKRIKLNGKGASRDTRICEGDVLSLYINDEFFDTPTPENAYLRITSPKVRIVYEDENLILADKPVGVLCHGDGGDETATLIANIQAYLYQKGDWRPREENSFVPALVNRIDRNTSGIIIAAKTAVAGRILSEKLREHELDKRYLCIVHGKMDPSDGTLSGFIFKDAKEKRVYVRKTAERGARSAVTDYRTLAFRNGLSLLECRLHTGRTHQIRAMLASAGHPLLGDGKYGTLRGSDNRGEKYQALCSYRLAFDFKTPAGELEYLRGRVFTLNEVSFADKYFPGIKYN